MRRDEPEAEGPQTGEEDGAAGRPRLWWWLVAVPLVGAAIALAAMHGHELAAAGHLIARVRLPRLAVAAVFEVASLLCFAGVPRWLLGAGGVRLRLRDTAALALGANAVAGALPGGAAFSTAWLFHQFRRRGADRVLAAAVLVVSGALSALALALLVLAGGVSSGLGGDGTVPRPLIGTALVVAGAGASASALWRVPGIRSRAQRVWAALTDRHRRLAEFQDALAHVVSTGREERPGWRPWLRPLGLALLNWAFDASCLAACLWALGIGVPWRGLLLAYGLTQIPGSLRLTPGSLGIVETSLTALLVLDGLPTGQALAATLLYRVCSYWALQPIGWAAWLALTLRPRGQEPHGPS